MRRGERGFSTIEAIVAVAIIAIALVPILSLQAQLAHAHVRKVEATERHSAVRNAMAVLGAINPTETPSGARDLGNGILSWRAAPLTPPRLTRNPTGFEVRLYKVSAAIDTRSATHAFAIDVIGWRKLAPDEINAPQDPEGDAR